MTGKNKIRRKLNNRKRILPILCVIIVLLCVGSFTGCTRAEAVKVTGFYFDTVITVEFYESEKMTLDSSEVEEGIKEICNHYENLLSVTVEDSDVSKINLSGGKPIEVDPDTACVLKKAIEVAGLTGGVYDPSIAPLSGLWNISEVSKTAGDMSEEERQKLIPSQENIKNACELIGYGNIGVDGTTVTLKKDGMQIDLGGIAKGYIADMLVEYLRSAGVEHALINLGGNVAALGGNRDGSSFWIGLQKPFGEGGEPLLKLKDTDKAIVTSGPYERYFKANNRIYHHILDITTGEPVVNDLYAVTIVGEEGVMADALSTACYCLGYEKSLELLDSLNGYDGIFIFDDYSYKTTNGFPKEYELSEVDMRKRIDENDHRPNK